MPAARAVAMVEAVTAPDLLDIVPEPVADPVRRAPWPERLRAALGGGFLSLVLNTAVVGWLVGIGWPLRPMDPPAPISVELVDHVPDGTGAGQTGEASPALSASAGAEKSKNAVETRPDTVAASEPAPAVPETPPEAAPSVDTNKQTAPAVPTDTQEGPSPDRTSPTAQMASEPPRPAATHDPISATPAPPEHPDATSQPRLVEAPSAPHAAVAGPEPEIKPAAAAAAPSRQPEPGPAMPAPDVMAGSESAEAFPPPAPQTQVPPQTAEQKRQAENTAKLAALLPFGANIMGTPDPAPASEGQGTSDSYRGAVYGNFNKAQDVIAAARAKHLKGQAVVAFTVDDHGGLASLALAVSSGNPQVDQAALDLIRHAAPFPPPPPGAQRSFSPAIGLGLD